jgi:hypothetical protein
MHYAMKVYGGVDVYTHVFYISALAGGEWSASLPGRFTAGERDPGTHSISGWVGSRTSLDNVEKIKFLTLLGLERDPSVVQPVGSRYTDCAIPAPHILSLIYHINKLMYLSSLINP